MGSRPKHLFEFGPFTVDPADRTLLRDGSPVPLQPKVFDTLLVLVKNGGHLVEKDEFIRAVWPEEQFVEEGNLNKNISKLRLALGECGDGTKYIETVPKSGYRLAAEVRDVGGGAIDELVVETQTRASLVVEEETDEETSAADGVVRVTDVVVVKPTTAAASPAQLPGKLGRHLKSKMVPAAAAFVMVLAAVIYLSYPEGGGEVIGSVAVLPFTNESNNPDVDYLSDGVSESLINRLSQLPGLKVIARSSSFKYRGQEVDPQEAARALGVQAIVSGRVVQNGDNLQVSVELVNARDKTQLWGEQYNRKASDLLAVQAEISREIADKLRLRLNEGERRQLGRRETVNQQAYELLLKGHFYFSKGRPGSGRRAVEYYEQAVAVDSSYAAAHAALAAGYQGLVGGSKVDPKEYTPKAREAARRALELDEGLAEAHQVMAFLHRDAWKWDSAEREYRRTIELNPNLGSAHMGYSVYLNNMGRHDEAVAEARRARELNPLDLFTNASVGLQLANAKRYDEAVEALRRTLDLEPSFIPAQSFLGYAYAAKGMYREAIAAHEEAVRQGDISTSGQVYLGASYAGAGEWEKAREILRRMETTKEYVSPAELAVLYVSLGERDKAFASLERAYSQHDLQLQYLKVEPGYNQLRYDPRFADLLRRVGLPL